MKSAEQGSDQCFSPLLGKDQSIIIAEPFKHAKFDGSNGHHVQHRKR